MDLYEVTEQGRTQGPGSAKVMTSAFHSAIKSEMCPTVIVNEKSPPGAAWTPQRRAAELDPQAPTAHSVLKSGQAKAPLKESTTPGTTGGRLSFKLTVVCGEAGRGGNSKGFRLTTSNAGQ